MRNPRAQFLAHANDAIAVDVLARHFFDRKHIAAMVLIDFEHLLEATGPGMDQHVGQQQGEGNPADQLTRAPHRVAEPQRFLLAGKARLPGARQVGLEQRQLQILAPPPERLLQFVLLVEMILDDALVASGDEDEVLDAGLARLIDRELDDRPVDNGEHLLGHRLGGGQEPGAEAGDGKHGFLEGAFHDRNGLAGWE